MGHSFPFSIADGPPRTPKNDKWRRVGLCWNMANVVFGICWTGIGTDSGFQGELCIFFVQTLNNRIIKYKINDYLLIILRKMFIKKLLGYFFMIFS